MQMSNLLKPLMNMNMGDPLDGGNYKRWNQKFLIFSGQLDPEYVLLQQDRKSVV